MFVSYQWSIVCRDPLKSHSSLFIVALFNARKSCGLSQSVLLEALQRAPLPRQIKHLLIRRWHLWEPWKYTGHALNWAVWPAQESEVRSHPGRKCVVWIWPKNVNFSLRNSSSVAIWASDVNHPPPLRPQGGGSVCRAVSLSCRYKNASVGKKRRFTILIP